MLFRAIRSIFFFFFGNSVFFVDFESKQNCEKMLRIKRHISVRSRYLYLKGQHEKTRSNTVLLPGRVFREKKKMVVNSVFFFFFF